MQASNIKNKFTSSTKFKYFLYFIWYMPTIDLCKTNKSSRIDQLYLYQTVPLAVILTVFFGVPEELPKASIVFTKSIFSTTSPTQKIYCQTDPSALKEITTVPKTTWAPSNQEVTTVVIKNWDPLVFLPALAIDRIPGLVCFNLKFSSTWNIVTFIKIDRG